VIPSFPVEANAFLSFGLLLMLVAITGAIIVTRSLLAAILLLAVYSLVSALWLLLMDAADVAFTEAAVGAGASTVVFLGAILLTRSRSRALARSTALSVGAVCLAVAAGLALAIPALPALGDPSSPANAHVGRWYLQNSLAETGAPNVVTAVLASFRGLDTLGETVVIFSAGLAVALLLGFGERSLASELPLSVAASPGTDGEGHAVLRVMARFLIPLIVLFGFYTVIHGEYGAGGGFQAGMIVAAGLILHVLVFGLPATMQALPPHLVRATASAGVLIYAGVGVLNLVNGGSFLDYDRVFPPGFEDTLPGSAALGGKYRWGQHFGIIGIEIGVLLAVAATILSMAYSFAGRAPEAEIAKADAR
jgi:multicomponent Na+:H+ antiporter subunit B